MDRRRFNKDMGDYIHTRKKISQPREVKLKFVKESEDKEIPEYKGFDVEYRPPGFWRRIFSSKRREEIERSEELTPEEKLKLLDMEAKVEGIEEEMQEIEEVEEELEAERESILDKIASFLGFGSKNYETIEDYDEEKVSNKMIVDEETKEVLKIMHTWIQKLSPKEKKAFKESGDFEKYKNTLVRFGLAKEKQKKEETKE